MAACFPTVMNETTSLQDVGDNTSDASRFALITPSASPPAARALANARRKSTSRPPPSKRARVGSNASFPSSPAIEDPPVASSSKTTLDPSRDEAWRASSQRLLNVWDSLAERYNIPIEEDDIVDIMSGEIVKDRGVTRRMPGQRIDFGRLLFGSPGRGTEDAEGGEYDEGEEGSESEEDLTTGAEDEVDEINAFESEPEVPIKVEIEKENRVLAPFTEMDPADAQDLKDFLEAEQRRKEALGDVDEEDEEAASDLGGFGDVNSDEERRRAARKARRSRVVRTRAVGAGEEDSEDEFAQWESSSPVMPSTPKRNSKTMPPETPKSRATPKPPMTPKPRHRSVVSEVIDLTGPEPKTPSRTRDVRERPVTPKANKTPRAKAKTPTPRPAAQPDATPGPSTRNTQLHTPPMSSRSSSGDADLVIPESESEPEPEPEPEPQQDADPYEAAAALFLEPTPPAVVSRPSSPVSRKTPQPRTPKSKRDKVAPTLNDASTAKRTDSNKRTEGQRQAITPKPGPSRAKTPKQIVEVIVRPRLKTPAPAARSPEPSRSPERETRSKAKTNAPKATPNTPAPSTPSAKAKGKQRELFTPSVWADLSDDDDVPLHPKPRISRTQTPRAYTATPAPDFHKRKRESPPRTPSPPATPVRTPVRSPPARTRKPRRSKSARRPSPSESSDEEPLSRTTSSRSQSHRSQSTSRRSQAPPLPAAPFSFTYPYPQPGAPGQYAPQYIAHHPPPPSFPVQDNMQYKFAEAMRYFSYLFSGQPTPPAFPPQQHNAYFPPAPPPHAGNWPPQTPRSHHHTRSRRDSSPHIPDAGPSSTYSTPSHHGYPYMVDPMYSSGTPPPASSSPAPSSPTTEVASSPASVHRDRGRSKSRGRRVSFKFDSDDDDEEEADPPKPAAVRGREPRGADKGKAPAPAGAAEAGGRRSSRRASSVGLPAPAAAASSSKSRRQASQAPETRRRSRRGRDEKEGEVSRQESPEREKRTERGRTPGPSSHRAKSAVVSGRWR